MNCAHHSDQAAVAYCRTCGKALCANCTRPVRGVIYCEDCLGQRMESAASSATFAPPQNAYQPVADPSLGARVSSAGFVPGTPGTVAPVAPPIAPRIPVPGSSGPNPTVAGILAGFFPFGVGAVYTGQYAKGLAHLAIFALLIAGISSDHGGEAIGVICGLGLSFFWVYQIVDAVRSARAIQAGLPAPDPYGLASTFGADTKIETSKIPFGAIILILLGVLFLASTMGLNFGLDRFWPVILIAVGGWMFVRNYGLVGAEDRLKNIAKIEGLAAAHGNPALMQQVIRVARCQCPHCRARRLMGPAILVTIGVLFLLENLAHIGFGRTWPILLLVIGAVKLFQSSASNQGHIAAVPAVPPIPPAPPMPPVPPSMPPSPNEVSHG